jgi:hypothetical protein
MKTAVAIVVLAMVLTGFSTASGQQVSTVGDVLDQGGKKLSKDEVKSLVSGATISGTQGGNFPNTTFTNVYSTHGSVNGDAWDKGTWFTKISGTWSVNELGQMCADLVNSQGGKIIGCGYYYALGSRYYYSARTDERSASVNERQIAR